MRCPLPIFVFCTVLVTDSRAQDRATSQEPSLATVIQQPGTRLQWVQEMGRLRSGNAELVVTAVIAASAVETTAVRRGLRIDLLDSNYKTTTFMDEVQVSALLSVLVQLSVESAAIEHRAVRQQGESRLGSCEYRDHPERFPVQVDYCYAGSCASALQVVSPTRLILADKTPADFSAILDRAIAQLKSH